MEIESLHASKVEALDAARAAAAPDGLVMVHDEHCATERDEPCSCAPFEVESTDPRSSAEILAANGLDCA